MMRIKNAVSMALAGLGLAATGAAPIVAQDAQPSDTYAVRGATLHTVANGTIENGTIVWLWHAGLQRR